MTFNLKIQADDQPGLIAMLQKAQQRLSEGGAFLNEGCGDREIFMKPATDKDEDEFRKQYAAAHPIPAARWTRV